MRSTANPDSYKDPEQPHASSNNNRTFYYDQPKYEPDSYMHPMDGLYSYTLPEGSGGEVKLPPDRGIVFGSPPPLPPRPSFMHLTPEYVTVLPSPASTPASPQTPPSPRPPPDAAKDKRPLPGNPNIVLISLGKLLSEEKERPSCGEPVSCSQCGSVLDSGPKDQVKVCYFCQCGDLTRPSSVSKCPLNGQKDELFLLSPHEEPLSAADSLLLFCIDVSGSMNITSEVENLNRYFTLGGSQKITCAVSTLFKVSEPWQNIHRTRLQFVQEAVLQCVQKLSDQQPEVRVGLITFSFQVTVHGCNDFQSHLLSGAELNNSSFLTEAAAGFPIPPPLSQTKDCLQRQILGLSANGETALGPAALLAVVMASRLPGSKVIICTDGKANAKLGNLEEEDNDARTLHSSTVFYQNIGEFAANQGVTVSVLSIEGTDCRLDELGRLADRTGGKVVIASPNQLHSEFEEIIENRTIATHCAVTFLLPKSLRMKGEREAGHKGTREVGNVTIDTEVTMQFGADEHTEDSVRKRWEKELDTETPEEKWDNMCESAAATSSSNYCLPSAVHIWKTTNKNSVSKENIPHHASLLCIITSLVFILCSLAVAPPAPGSCVLMQLQIRYKRNGRALLRVFTAEREVTDDSSAALSSLSLSVVQLNSLQASASLAVRGRFLDARKEGALQQQLVERAIEHNQSAEDQQTYQEWVKTMQPINNTYTLTRRGTVLSDSESLTDAGAALLITMKHSNRKSISLKDKHRL
ncbi:uncharacterized protein FYW61_018202 [Anableps anableps]